MSQLHIIHNNNNNIHKRIRGNPDVAESNQSIDFAPMQKCLKDASNRYKNIIKQYTQLKLALAKLEAHKAAGTIPKALHTPNRLMLPKEDAAMMSKGEALRKQFEQANLQLVIDARNAQFERLQKSISEYTHDEINKFKRLVDDSFQLHTSLGITLPYTAQEVIDTYKSSLTKSMSDIAINLSYSQHIQREKEQAKRVAMDIAEEKVHLNPEASIRDIVKDEVNKRLHSLQSQNKKPKANSSKRKQQGKMKQKGKNNKQTIKAHSQKNYRSGQNRQSHNRRQVQVKRSNSVPPQRRVRGPVKRAATQVIKKPSYASVVKHQAK